MKADDMGENHEDEIATKMAISFGMLVAVQPKTDPFVLLAELDAQTPTPGTEDAEFVAVLRALLAARVAKTADLTNEEIYMLIERPALRTKVWARVTEERERLRALGVTTFT